MRAEISVTRRATHKAEENIKGIEKNKVSRAGTGTVTIAGLQFYTESSV